MAGLLTQPKKPGLLANVPVDYKGTMGELPISSPLGMKTSTQAIAIPPPPKREFTPSEIPVPTAQQLIDRQEKISATPSSRTQQIAERLPTFLRRPFEFVVNDVRDGLFGNPKDRAQLRELERQGMSVSLPTLLKTEGFFPFLGRSQTDQIEHRILKHEEAGVSPERASELAFYEVFSQGNKMPGTEEARIQKQAKEKLAALKPTASEKRTALLATAGQTIGGGLDVAGVFPVGSIGISTTGAEAIARSRNAAEIVNIFKQEVPKITDEIASVFAKLLVNVDNVDDVQRVINKTNFVLQNAKKQFSNVSEIGTVVLNKNTTRLMKSAGFADDVIKDYAPMFAKVIRVGLLTAEKLPIDYVTVAQPTVNSALKDEVVQGKSQVRVTSKGINYTPEINDLSAQITTKYPEVPGAYADQIAEDVRTLVQEGGRKIDDALKIIEDRVAKLPMQEINLATEARKYSSAEEFVKAQTPLYRGKGVSGDVSLSPREGIIGVPTTADKGIATIYDKGGKGLTEGYLSPTAKVAKTTDVPTKLWSQMVDKANAGGSLYEKEFVPWAKANGYDVAYLPLENEYRILNDKAFLTKSQLIDFWKKATATPTRSLPVLGAQDVTVGRPTLSTTPDQLPSGVPQSTTAIAEPSLAEVKQISDDIATPFKQVVGIGAQTTKEPALFKRVTTKLGQAFRSTVEYVQNAETRVQKLLERPDVRVTEASNPYQKMTLYPGSVATKIENVRVEMESMANDIVDVADRTGRDTSLVKQDVNEYLQATHAPERNAALGDGAAGMTNAEAAAVLKRLGDSSDIKRIAEQARKMNEQGLILLKDAGVISDELFTTLTKKYPNHVPLQRIFDEDEIQGVLSVRGFDVRSSGIKRAKGSEREVSDILANIQHNYEQAVLRSEKNIVDQATLAFVRENRDALKGLIEIRKPRAIGKDFEGKILMERTTDPSYLQLYENGKPVWIKINDPALALAFKGTGREKLPSLLRWIGSFTRFYAGLATRFNPEFAFPNKLRDLQETMIYMAAQKDIGFKGAAKMLIKDPASTKAVWDSIRGVDSPGARMYAEMKSLGGTTGGFGLSTRKQVELDLENMINTAKSRPKQAAQDVLQYIDNWNTVFEDSTRLSVYKQALSQGLSKERAAFLAKEASINFNRMGRGGPVINSMWMFANASIQGSAKMIRSLKNPKVAAAVVTIIGASVASVNTWNDRVDPDWRNKVTKWDRLNGLPIMLPADKDGGAHYVVIPVSWGVKPIKVMADFAYDAQSGIEMDFSKVASDLFTAVADSYNPLGGTDAVSAFTPTILDVPVEVVRNQQWSGSKIRPDFDKNAPKDVQYFDTLGETATGQLFINLTKKLQESTGVAFSPADLNYAFNQYIGGAGKASLKTANTIIGVATGKDVPADEYPFVSRFYRTRTQEEVGMGAGGDTSVLKSVLENQSRERFYATQGAEDAYTRMKALPLEEAARQWNELYKTDPDTAKKVADIAEQEKKGLNYTERLITQLGVTNGERALYIKTKFDELKSQTDKAELWQDYVTKGIITPQVADQISYLLKSGDKTSKTIP